MHAILKGSGSGFTRMQNSNVNRSHKPGNVLMRIKMRLDLVCTVPCIVCAVSTGSDWITMPRDAVLARAEHPQYLERKETNVRELVGA